MSNKTLLMIGGGLLALLVVAGGVWLYDFAQGDTLAPSGPLTAVPVNTPPPATTVADTPTQPTPDSPADEPTPPPATTAPVLFVIQSDESEARFSIYEELNGQPKTVVGATDQVAGELAIDLNDLSQTRVGVIQVNARALQTDSDRRNRAIRNFILNTDQYELITFTPTRLTGLNGVAQTGQPFTFQIVGDLTIRNLTQPATFTVTVTGESVTRIVGSATTIVKRGDYRLTIPDVPNVANVGEEVTLEFDFVAEASQ